MGTQDLKISETGLKISCGVLFGIAMIAAFFRTLIRLRTQSSLALDDFFLLFGCTWLVVSFTLFYILVPGLFILQDLQYGMPTAEPMEPIVKMLYIWNPPAWFTLYSIRFCFLFLFRKLIGVFRRPMAIYWRFIAGWTAICAGIHPGIWFMACRPTGQAFLNKLGESSAVGTTIVSICLDVFTELLILSIPIIIVWNMRAPLCQKLGIGIFLTFNVVMLSIAVVKLFGLTNTNGSVDAIWQCFWQQIEISLAVLMASLTAFRAIFISNTNNRRKPRSLFWYGEPEPVVETPVEAPPGEDLDAESQGSSTKSTLPFATTPSGNASLYTTTHCSTNDDSEILTVPPPLLITCSWQAPIDWDVPDLTRHRGDPGSEPITRRVRSCFDHDDRRAAIVANSGVLRGCPYLGCKGPRINRLSLSYEWSGGVAGCACNKE